MYKDAVAIEWFITSNVVKTTLALLKEYNDDISKESPDQVSSFPRDMCLKDENTIITQHLIPFLQTYYYHITGGQQYIPKQGTATDKWNEIMDAIARFQ